MKTIKQFVAEHLVNTEIFEMAQSLDRYKESIENMIIPIISHILLIMKANKENSTEFVDHWKKEIRGFLSQFVNFNLKTKNTYNAKYKHVYNKLINELELNTNNEWILARIWNKMEQEGYDFQDKNIYNEFNELIDEFQEKYLNNIIELIAKGNVFDNVKFVNEL